MATEYVPGFIANDGTARRTFQGTIDPGYIDQYIAEGGEIICREVGPWRTYKPDEQEST